jgi:hypothetical protein
LSPFTKPPAPKQTIHRVAPRKKVEQQSVLNSDISGPILAVLAPVLTILSPLLGRLKLWQAWLLGVTVAFVALVVVANIEYAPKRAEEAARRAAIVETCQQAATVAEQAEFTSSRKREAHMNTFRACIRGDLVVR